METSRKPNRRKFMLFSLSSIFCWALGTLLKVCGRYWQVVHHTIGLHSHTLLKFYGIQYYELNCKLMISWFCFDYTSWKPVLRTDFLWTSWGLNRIEHQLDAMYPHIPIPNYHYRQPFPSIILTKGVGGVGAFPRSQKQKILGSNPVAAYPERRTLRTQHSCVYANSSGWLSRMIGKPWLRVKWGSLLKDPQSCKGILQLM
jgi:hypothetical protein